MGARGYRFLVPAAMMLSTTCGDAGVGPVKPGFSSTPIGTNSIDGTGLNLDQVLVSSGIPASRTVISAGFFRPSIALLPNGSLLAAMFEVGADENVVVSRSSDGKTWSTPQIVLPGRDPYVVRLRDGTLLLSHATLPSDSRFPNKGFISISKDDGQTWARTEITPSLIPAPAAEVGGAHSIIQLRSGEVLAFQAAKVGTESRVYVLRSNDSGQSWSSGEMAFRFADEVSAVELRSGRILAAVRVDGPPAGLIGDSRQFQPFVDTAHPTDAITMSNSDDNGRTWTPLKQILPASAVPAHLLVLNDDRVVMTYGVRFWPRGVQAVISTDGGQIWDFSRRYVLCWHSLDFNAGYPWSIQLADGSILTSYYARRTEQTPGVFVSSDIYSETIRWTP